MSNCLKVLAGFLMLVFIASCKDEEKPPAEKDYSLFCWPSRTPCDNLDYGIEFSYQTMVVQPGNPQPAYRRTATLVCCRYIEELMDTLALYNSLLQRHRDKGLGNLSRSCRIGPDIEVHVDFSVSGPFMPYSFSTLGFKDIPNPFAFDLSVPQFEYFQAFKDEVMEMYRECCGREEEGD